MNGMKKRSFLLASAVLLGQQQILAAEGEAGEIEEIVTLGNWIPDEKRSTAVVSSVLDTAALERAGDSNIAEGLKRLSGLNLSQGKYVYVRGLGERYSSTLFNGSSLPSPEPIRRVVPLDLFPASVIDSVLVQKTWSASLPAEFGGGSIGMRSKTAPDEPFFEVKSSVGHAGGTSFRDGLRYDGGGSDWLGNDRGTRDLPDPVKDAIAGDKRLRKNSLVFRDGVSAAELETLGESLPNNYALNSEEIGPDYSASASMGTRLERGDLVFGLLSSLSYSNSWDSLEVVRNDYNVREVDGEVELVPYNEQMMDFTERSIDTSLFLSGGVEIGNNHQIKATGLQVRKTDDQASLVTGHLATEDLELWQPRLEWIENDLLTLQLDGEHWFDGPIDISLGWHLNESRAKREAPDMRQYRYDWNERAGRHEFSLRGDANQRSWSWLEDNNEDMGLEGSLFLQTPFGTETELSFGMNRLRKERDSRIRRFTFISQGGRSNDADLRALPLEQVLSADNIAPDGFELRESTRATDTYMAEQALDAAWVEADIQIGNAWRLLAGLRQEESRQEVSTYDLFNRDADPIVSDLASDDLFPVVVGTWILDKYDMQLRLGYSETISRPDFRELSPAPFTDPINGYEIVGNPALKVAYIDNYDLRWEWYFSADESLSVGLFHKEFADPIEAVRQPGEARNRTFINASQAELRGIEIDAFRWLDFVHEDLGNWYTAANLTLIESEVSIPADNAVIVTNRSRALQGQADYILNLQLGYDDGFRNRASMVYHLTGEKIQEVGVLGAPDVLDEAYGELDLNYTRYWNESLSISLRASNLLNQARETTQGGRIFNSYKEGRNFSVSASWTF